MAIFHVYLILISVTLTKSCDVFVGMTCTCYESTHIRCATSKIAPLRFSSSSIFLTRKFHSIDLKFNSDDIIELDENHFSIINQLFPPITENISLIFRFQNFRSFHAKPLSFAQLYQGITSTKKYLTIELHPVKPNSIKFDQNTFDQLHLDELSIFGDSLTSPFESIFNNTNIVQLNIEGAIVIHDPLKLKDFNGHIQSLKITRMIDNVNSDEFPPFPVQSYTIEAHKMRTLDALSFLNYTQLTGLNIIQPDVSITPKILRGLEYISTLKTISFDAERIADGALKHVKHIDTLVLGSYTKILDAESLNSLKLLKRLDVRYVQFSTLQGDTSCSLTDFINRRRMMGLTVYLPKENPYCDCILVFLNNMIDDGSQLIRCQSATNDRCLFSSCAIVSEYFTRKQKENIEEQQRQNTSSVITPSHSLPIELPFVPPTIDLNDNNLPYYPDEYIFEQEEQIMTTSSTNKPFDEYIDDDQDINIEKSTHSLLATPFLSDSIGSDGRFSTPFMTNTHPDSKKHPSRKYLSLPWIPFAIIASCLFVSLIIAMITCIICDKRRINSYNRVPQTSPIV